MSGSIQRINNCGNCAYMDLQRTPQGKGQLVCRLNPPIGHPVVAIASEGEEIQPRFLGTITVWPEVEENLWCGRHSPNRIEQVREIPKEMQTFGIGR